MKDFKAFAMKGNVVDLAIVIVIGAAFGKIVSSFVADIVTPPIGLLFGNVNFSDLAVTLKEAGPGVAAVTLNYGKFIQTILDFIIIAFAILKLPAASCRESRFSRLRKRSYSFANPAASYGECASLQNSCLVKGMMVMKNRETEAPVQRPVPTREEILLEEIRDTLKQKRAA